MKRLFSDMFAKEIQECTEQNCLSYQHPNLTRYIGPCIAIIVTDIVSVIPANPSLVDSFIMHLELKAYLEGPLTLTITKPSCSASLSYENSNAFCVGLK
jgi:hypothetical protein